MLVDTLSLRVLAALPPVLGSDNSAAILRLLFLADGLHLVISPWLRCVCASATALAPCRSVMLGISLCQPYVLYGAHIAVMADMQQGKGNAWYAAMLASQFPRDPVWMCECRRHNGKEVLLCTA